MKLKPGTKPAKIHFVCGACGEASPKWQGRCGACGDWNTLVEEAAPRSGPARPPAAAAGGAIMHLPGVAVLPTVRHATSINECDRVLGGGVVPGALILLGGDPGIGKSTLALQIAAAVGTAGNPALYCAGEESASQLAMRARRTGCAVQEVGVLAETDLDVLIATIEEAQPRLAVIDSVQTVYDQSVPGAPGSVSQVREAVARLLRTAKSTGIPILLIGHVTKDGAIAGPRTLEHMVDVVLYLEGERHGDHRILRGIKNRFGATGDVGLFTMAGSGMEQLSAPGRAFLDEVSLGVPGNVLTVLCEGTRPLAVEVQALTTPTPFGLPRRTASGFDLGRLHLLLAVLEKRAKVRLGQADVYVNAVGGVRLAEPACDLAVALAIAGSASDRLPPVGTLALGEVGLGGEVRRVPRLEQRLTEGRALGTRHAVIPASHERSRLPSGITYHPAHTVAEALRILR
jgi:DNA repair protein RadA/Sms